MNNYQLIKHAFIRNHYIKSKIKKLVSITTTRNYSSSQTNAQYCLNAVRHHDYENFLCTLLLNGKTRRGAFAVRAFNVEVSRIISIVSDDKIGVIRLKFWEDAINKIFSKDNPPIPEHPVIQELKYIVDNNKLTKRYFQRLIMARNRPSNLGFMTMKEIEEYCENTVSSVLFLLLELHGINNVNADHAASHLGKSQGLANMLRSIPFLTRSIALPIPQEILIKHGVSQERIIRNSEKDKGVQECIFDVATLAHQHLEKSRNLMKSTPKDSRIVLLPAVAVSRYLEKLRQSHFHLTQKQLMSRDSLLPLAYYKCKLFNSY